MILDNFKVGFNNRKDTYTKKLGFINYKKIDGTWKNKLSYDTWIDSTIPEEEYENDILSGFVINNNVGYMSYGDGREPKVRILDPRGFEIEITMGNFFDIISYGVGEGKVLNGSYCYGVVNNRITLIHESKVNKTDNTVRLYVKDEPLEIGNIYRTTLEDKGTSYVYVGDKKTTVMKRNKMVDVELPHFILLKHTYFTNVGLVTDIKPNKFKTVDSKHKELISNFIKTHGDFQELLDKKVVKIHINKIERFIKHTNIASKYIFIEYGDKVYSMDFIIYRNFLIKENYDVLPPLKEINRFNISTFVDETILEKEVIRVLSREETTNIMNNHTKSHQMVYKEQILITIQNDIS